MLFVTESLVTVMTALSEVGCTLCRYFDLADTGSAFRALTALLDAPGSVAAWENEVRQSCCPTPWADTAAVVVVAHAGAEVAP